MAAQTQGSLKKMMIDRYIAIGLVILLVTALAIGYVSLQTDQAIAPPGLRVMDGLWRLLVFWV